MSAPTLTAGAVSKIFETKKAPEDPVVFQVLNMKGVNGNRWKLTVSDGEHFCICFLASQLNKMISDGAIKEHSVVNIETMNITPMEAGKIAIMVVKIDVVDSSLSAPIGSPVSILKKSESPVKQEMQSPEAQKKASVNSPTPHGPPSSSPATSPMRTLK
jgi:hypothetical protein